MNLLIFTILEELMGTFGAWLETQTMVFRDPESRMVVTNFHGSLLRTITNGTFEVLAELAKIQVRHF